ncbi:putative thioredoxin [Xylaria palmicola]|nr:putative thioredoxin [Xylaria palmicola]
MTNFTITIVSDPVCPWCYIGQKRLNKAISLYKKVYPGGRADTFTVTWKAFYLDASAPAQGITWDQRLRQKLAASKPGRAAAETDQLVVQLRDHLASTGRPEGIEFSFAGLIGNTRSAHRAIAFSKRARAGAEPTPDPDADVHNRFVAALFAAYFEGTADITSHAALADVAASVGLGRAEMLAWLDDGKGGEEVDEEDRAARELGLQGVPNLIVQGVTMQGASDIQDLLEVFTKVKEEERERAQEQI